MASNAIIIGNAFRPNHMTRLVLLLCISMIGSGCATSQNPQDPWEGMNRKIYGVNKGIVHACV